MALLPYSPTPIELPVSSRVVGDTIFRQKARFMDLTHTQSPEGTCRVVVRVLVSLYAAQGEGFGPMLSGLGVSPYIMELVADNNTLVEATTGDILTGEGGKLYIRGKVSEQEWEAASTSSPTPLMYQGDFFEYLRENSPINISALIRQHINQADQMGKFSG